MLVWEKTKKKKNVATRKSFLFFFSRSPETGHPEVRLTALTSTQSVTHVSDVVSLQPSHTHTATREQETSSNRSGPRRPKNATCRRSGRATNQPAGVGPFPGPKKSKMATRAGFEPTLETQRHFECRALAARPSRLKFFNPKSLPNKSRAPVPDRRQPARPSRLTPLPKQSRAPVPDRPPAGTAATALTARPLRLNFF